jgi:glycosyltransferase involved in cell wall biosynthesis
MGSVKIEDVDDEVKNTPINPMTISITPDLISEARKKVVLVMMVKNEEKRLEVSFNSVKEYADTFVILDTGSTDRTTMIIKNYCKKHNINLFLKEEPFVDFAASRNVLLKYADEVLRNPDGSPDVRYLLQLDCNDELRNADELVKLALYFKGPQTAFYIKQMWKTPNNSVTTYYNLRLHKSHSGWFYNCPVHEYMHKDTLDQGDYVSHCRDLVLFQDRTKDDDKTMKRFVRDKPLLYKEYLKDPHNSRVLFYLAQTCACLRQVTEAYNFYYLRTLEGGFAEEVYHSYQRLGDISITLGHPWEETMSWYLKAYAHSKRAEPLVKIAEYYTMYNTLGEKSPDWNMCYLYISQACKLFFPHNTLLFVDRYVYLYKRWHILGTAAFYVNRFKEGKDACIRAIQAEHQPIDYSNLVNYLKNDREIVANKDKNISNFNWDSSLIISTDWGDIVPTHEVQLMKEVYTTSKEEVLKKAYEMLIQKKIKDERPQLNLLSSNNNNQIGEIRTTI